MGKYGKQTNDSYPLGPLMRLTQTRTHTLPRRVQTPSLESKKLMHVYLSVKYSHCKEK